MTKANQTARKAVSNAEKRARAKVKRLQSKGVRTGSIEPFREVDPTDTRAMKRYAQDLERFISRQTRFVAGRDGTPIPYNMWRDYQRLERKWNKVHNEYWRNFAPRPFTTAYGQQDVTMGELSSQVHIKGQPYGDIGYERHLLPQQVRGIGDIKKRMKQLKTEISPTYRIKRAKQLRKDMMKYADAFNDPSIPRMIRKLTYEQLILLQETTNFVPLYFRYIETDTDNDRGVTADANDEEGQLEHLKLTIKQVVNQTVDFPKFKKAMKIDPLRPKNKRKKSPKKSKNAAKK